MSVSNHEGWSSGPQNYGQADQAQGAAVRGGGFLEERQLAREASHMYSGAIHDSWYLP